LLERVRAKRRAFHDEERPIIFICHSLGGIVLKKALIVAHQKAERYSSISRDTFGVMFMGTPHRGSDVAFWGKVFGTMADVLTVGSIRTQLLQDLLPKSSCLGEICLQFVERSQSLRIFTIYERLKIKGVPGLVLANRSNFGRTTDMSRWLIRTRRSFCSPMKHQYQLKQITGPCADSPTRRVRSFS
jgi:hypothetical protein